MTKRECAIVEAYTGVVMCAGKDTMHVYKYLEDIIGHPVYTHEIYDLMEEIQEKSKPDFVRLCKDSTDFELGADEKDFLNHLVADLENGCELVVSAGMGGYDIPDETTDLIVKILKKAIREG